MVKRFKKFSSIVVLLCFIFVLSACSTKTSTEKKDNWSKYKSEKSITIGFDNTFVPMGFKDKSGRTTGFDIDLANAVFSEYGIKVKWQPINWDLKETELKNGKIDLIWNGYSITNERKEKVSFSNTYMKNEQVLVTKKTSNITSFSEMKGKTLGAQSGSSGYDTFISNPTILKDIVKDKEATQYETFTQALIDLKNNRIDGLLIDKVYANYYLEKEGILNQYNIIKSDYPGEDFAVGARKSDKILINKIDKAFKKLYQTGKFQEISNKWFGEDIASNSIK